MADRKVYLDYNATTPLAPEVLESINLALRDFWGNPSSSHDAGLWRMTRLINFTILVINLSYTHLHKFHTHTQTYGHAYIHTHTHTYTHTHTHIRTRTHAHTHTPSPVVR